MSGRYCVSWVSGWMGLYGDFGPLYSSKSFDSYDEAAAFREELRDQGADVADIMGLENLPF